MMPMNVVLVALIVLAGTAACDQALTTARPASPWPVAPEVLATATSGELPSQFGPANWAFDPAFPAPGPANDRLFILVWERACSSGSPATGRMSAPVIETAPTTVTITIGVRPVSGMQTCPLPPGTPAVVTLPEPLGARSLRDGGSVPPAPPSPAFQPPVNR